MCVCVCVCAFWLLETHPDAVKAFVRVAAQQFRNPVYIRPVCGRPGVRCMLDVRYGPQCRPACGDCSHEGNTMCKAVRQLRLRGSNFELQTLNIPGAQTFFAITLLERSSPPLYRIESTIPGSIEEAHAAHPSLSGNICDSLRLYLSSALSSLVAAIANVHSIFIALPRAPAKKQHNPFDVSWHF